MKAAEKISPEEVKRVKALGCLKDKRYEDIFNVRVLTRNGKITAQEARVIAEASERFGSGSITMTTRLTQEIQGVPYDKLEEVFAFLKENGLETGGTGAKVRPVVSCKGTTCQYGLLDTYDLSEKIHQRFYEGYHDMKLPHKFKIAVGGCPNNCVKPDLNDLGIIGQRIPNLDEDACNGCKKCGVEKACPMGAARMEDGLLEIDRNVCNNCGRCIDHCHFDAMEGTYGYKIYIGGRWGKKTALAVIEKAILLFREQGKTGERFAKTIERLGFENVEAQLLGNELLERKQQILDADLHMTGGATC